MVTIWKSPFHTHAMGVLKTGFVNPKQRQLQVTNPFSLFSQAIHCLCKRQTGWTCDVILQMEQIKCSILFVTFLGWKLVHKLSWVQILLTHILQDKNSSKLWCYDIKNTQKHYELGKMFQFITKLKIFYTSLKNLDTALFI